jgi:hypothetical protein
VRRLALLTSALLVPLLPAAPAQAAASVICVNTSDPTCTTTVATIPLAITASDANAVDDTILVGPGTYTDGPYILDGTVHAVTLKGAGQGSTILTMPVSGTRYDYVTGNHAVVQDLTVQLAASAVGDTGLALYNGSTATNVTVDGTGSSNASGMHLAGTSLVTSTASHATITMPFSSGSRGIYGEGAAVVTDSTITADNGFDHSGTGVADTLSRVSMTVRFAGVTTDSGTVDVDDSVIDLGTYNATGLYAANSNPGTAAKAINADHVTIVGGGASSKGVYAGATSGTVQQVSTVQLDNSIVEGPANDLVAQAQNNGGVLAQSTATITSTYSDWSTKLELPGTNGLAQVISGTGNLDVDPAFVDAAGHDHRLATGSPVIDHGDPAAGGPTTDLAGGARVLDGNGDGSAVRDMGAYEHAAVPVPVVVDRTAPNTTITSKPAKRVKTRRVTFRFASTEAGSRFSCKLDARAWRSCASPYRFRVTVGVHRFRVRATDAHGNTDATPATYRFRRVR